MMAGSHMGDNLVSRMYQRAMFASGKAWHALLPVVPAHFDVTTAWGVGRVLGVLSTAGVRATVQALPMLAHRQICAWLAGIQPPGHAVSGKAYSS